MKFLRRLRDEGPLPVARDAEAPEPTAAGDAVAPAGAPEPTAADEAVTSGPTAGTDAVASAGAASEVPPPSPSSPIGESGRRDQLVEEAPRDESASSEASLNAAEPPLPAASDMAEGDPDVDAGDAPAAGRSAEAPEPPRIVLVADAHAAPPAGDGRPADLQLAGLHLRTGLHALARAELEALAGRGRLDEAALLDLAEVRWRTGDLAGAGEAANALLARGAESPLALVIAAEAVAAAGRPAEARRLSSRAAKATDTPLDSIFAGMPRAGIWPETPAAEPAALPAVGRGRGRSADAGGAPSTASEAFAGGRAALARGDSTRAALLLGVAMRLSPGFAEDVLRAVAGRDDQPLIALVRGDALRLLGREAEALEAFDRARGRAVAGEAPSRRRNESGPGLFDDDRADAGEE